MKLVPTNEGNALELPTAIDENDALQLEKLSLEYDLLNAQMRLIQEKITAHAERGNAFGRQLRTKYQINDTDIVDVAARTIERK